MRSGTDNPDNLESLIIIIIHKGAYQLQLKSQSEVFGLERRRIPQANRQRLHE